MKLFRLLPFLAIVAAPFALAQADQPAKAEAKDCCAPVATACPVSGETLGSMGEPFVYVHKEEGKPDREIRLCCRMCLPRFKKEPAPYLAKLDAAADAGCEDPAKTAAADACCAAPGEAAGTRSSQS